MLKWPRVPAGDAIRDRLTYCCRCVENRRKALWLYSTLDDPWDRTVQSSDRADTGPNRTGNERSVAIIGRRGEHATSGWRIYLRRADVVELIRSLDPVQLSPPCDVVPTPVVPLHGCRQYFYITPCITSCNSPTSLSPHVSSRCSQPQFEQAVRS